MGNSSIAPLQINSHMVRYFDLIKCVHCYDHSLDEMCVVGDDGGGGAFRTD